MFVFPINLWCSVDLGWYATRTSKIDMEYSRSLVCYNTCYIQSALKPVYSAMFLINIKGAFHCSPLQKSIISYQYERKINFKAIRLHTQTKFWLGSKCNFDWAPWTHILANTKSHNWVLSLLGTTFDYIWTVFPISVSYWLWTSVKETGLTTDYYKHYRYYDALVILNSDSVIFGGSVPI